MKVVIIGTGNTATVLGRLISSKGHLITQVYGRNPLEADRLASVLECSAITELSNLDTTSEIFIVAVSDSSIAEVANALTITKGIIVHTAGSVSISILKEKARNYGVLYPLQSLRKESINIPHIPFLIEGNTEDVTTLIQDFAGSLSTQVQRANDDERKKLHLAAIIVNNFPNYLYALAADYCQKNKVDFSLLLPLIKQTSDRLFEQSPKQTQTGPATRGDIDTISKHLDMLADDKELHTIYNLFTTNIQSYFKK